MELSEKLKEWYGMPEFQPSKVDEGILVIINEIAQLEAANVALLGALTKVCDQLLSARDMIHRANPDIDLLEALEEIAKGTGAYSLDKLTHAHNIIDNLVTIAKHAIGGTTELVGALESMLKALDVALRAAPNSEVNVSDAFIIVGAKEKANKAIKQANAP